MSGKLIEIASRDPLRGEDSQVGLEPGGEGDGCPRRQSSRVARQEAGSRATLEVQGMVISMDEAIVAGRAVFGDILKEA